MVETRARVAKPNRRPEVQAVLDRYEADLRGKAEARIDEAADLMDQVRSAQSDGIRSWQEQIDRGNWSMEGSWGRTMMAFIQDGKCVLGDLPARDYWGNQVPAWWMLDAGTPGTPEFVAREQEREDAW